MELITPEQKILAKVREFQDHCLGELKILIGCGHSPNLSKDPTFCHFLKDSPFSSLIEPDVPESDVKEIENQERLCKAYEEAHQALLKERKSKERLRLLEYYESELNWYQDKTLDNTYHASMVDNVDQNFDKNKVDKITKNYMVKPIHREVFEKLFVPGIEKRFGFKYHSVSDRNTHTASAIFVKVGPVQECP